MQNVFARKALLVKGWSENVRLRIVAGRIESVSADALPEDSDQQVDILIPGLSNAHSHAFQRALVGRTERRSPEGEDNFWSWRTEMYKLANKVSAEQLAAIATQAYNEMLQAGYTSVAEFHYLHREPEANGDAMFNALQSASIASGIRLVYVPVLYERAGFDNSKPAEQQHPFVLALDEFLAHYTRCTVNAAEATTVAIGAHSLRAVSERSLKVIADVALEQDIPLHLHIAEQTAEVEQCVAAHGKRPVEYLLQNFAVDDRWCLVHATHIDDNESEALARSGAVVCICPTTEANLGDGLFPLRPFLKSGGNIAIGSDSQVSIDPFEELRWLEYGQRLASRSRNIVSLEHVNVGYELFARALRGGAQAIGQKSIGIAEGAGADLVALRSEDAVLADQDDDSLLDALIFSGYRLPIAQVMACGVWQVKDGEHVEGEAARVRYRHALRALR
ncbi:MAG: formimidoylglutamate deiminase [Woeseiaceae bacterium]